MGKFEAKKEKKKFPVWIVVLILALLAAAFVLSRLAPGAEEQQPTEPAQQNTEATQTEQPQQQTQPQEQTEPSAAPTASAEKVEFPLTVEDGALELQALFQFSGVNPDRDYEEADNIAALELLNLSDAFLVRADLVLTMSDGTVYRFAVTQLPAGTRAMAFDLENQALSENAVCTDLSCEAEFIQPDDSVSSRLTWSVEGGIMVTVTNTSAEDLQNIVVYCRAPFGDEYFGGITYEYTIDELPAGESATVEAWECLLGEVEVVRVAIGES